MKQVSVDNLKENDILAFPILSHSGTVLIHADVALTEELIERAINLGVRTVYIKDEKEGIVRENTSDSDTAREEEEYPYRLEETANNSRQIVKKILEKYKYDPKECILIGDSINDYEAANINGIKFYGYNNEELRSLDEYIEDSKDFLIWI